LKNRVLYHWAVLAIILTACAQIKPPTGGPKDETPPEVILMVPANLSTQFTAKRIYIEFDEFVQLRNLSAQLVINPSMKERPEFRLKGKKLLINLKSPLEEATTYVINFGDAVVDLTEGNKAQNLQYVFSTGSYIDSLRFEGKVIDAFEKKPVENTLVMLYNNANDTMPYKGTPDYFAKTDKSGNFEINYIRSGTYMAFALKDENSNYKFNPGEMIGFLDSLVVPGPPDSTNIPETFFMFYEKDTMQYIDERNPTFYGQYQMILHQPADTFSITPIDDEISLYTESGVNGDTLTTWFLNRKDFPDREAVKMIVKASPGLVDTTNWKLTRRRADEDPVMEIKDNLLFNFNPDRPMRFKFNHPIVKVDTQNIALYRDSILVDFEWKSTESPRKFELHHEWEPGAPYRIFARDSTFWDVFELTNDTLDKTVTMREDRYFGNLKFDFTFDESDPIILEMLNDKGMVVKKIIPEESGILVFDRMNPGTYKMRVIYDLNQNGEWDTGNFLLRQQPEPVSVFPGSIQIRSNWDMEMEWDIREEEEIIDEE